MSHFNPSAASECCSRIMATLPFSCCCCWPEFSSVPDVEVCAGLQNININLPLSWPKTFPIQMWLSCSKSALFKVFQQLLFREWKCLDSNGQTFWSQTCMSTLETAASFVSGYIDSAVFLTFSFCVCVREWVKQAITIRAVWLGVFPGLRCFFTKRFTKWCWFNKAFSVWGLLTHVLIVSIRAGNLSPVIIL